MQIDLRRKIFLIGAIAGLLASVVAFGRTGDWTPFEKDPVTLPVMSKPHAQMSASTPSATVSSAEISADKPVSFPADI